MHTPGPWTRGSEASDGWYIYAGETPIARTIASVSAQEERDNARLMGSAPKLLEACKAIRRIADETEPGTPFDAVLSEVAEITHDLIIPAIAEAESDR